MRNIAIIPARSGSKGLVDKNIKLLNGKHLIAYTIEAAINSGVFEEVFVSTDSKMYAEIARMYGANVPFLRSERLASDSASSWDAVREALITYKEFGKTFDTVALLQPTSPLRDKDDIINAFKLFTEKKKLTVISACEVDHPIQWCFSLNAENSIELTKPEYRNMRRQDIPKTYRENGAIYIVDTTDLMNGEYDIYQKRCYAYLMERKKSFDIDEQSDFDIVEYLISKENEEDNV